MLGIRYMKAPPTTFVVHYWNGRAVREGAGLSFFYHAPTSTIVTVPLASTDLPFAFQEVTADFQTVTLQGQLTYRVSEPLRLAQTMDFSLNPKGEYRSDDPEVLRQRLVHLVQVQARASLQGLPLRQALPGAQTVAREVLSGLRESPSVTALGVEVQALSIVSMKPTPEMSRALEAEAREALNRRADEAVYSRRNAAVEQERMIKESELATELAVEEKRRQIREAAMAADIALEEQRAALVAQKLENDRLEAEARGFALDTALRPVRDMDWRTLMALGGAEPGLMIASAFRELAENAQKIGELNVSPDLLRSLMAPRAKA